MVKHFRIEDMLRTEKRCPGGSLVAQGIRHAALDQREQTHQDNLRNNFGLGDMMLTGVRHIFSALVVRRTIF